MSTEIIKVPFYKSPIVLTALATIFIGSAEQLNLLGTNLISDQYQGVFAAIMGVLLIIARNITASTITVKK